MKYIIEYNNYNPVLSKSVKDFVYLNKYNLPHLWSDDLSDDENIDFMIDYFTKYPNEMNDKNLNIKTPIRKDNDYINYAPVLQNIGGSLNESHESMWDIIPQSIKDIHTLFKRNDKKLYLVGGSIRDFLIGEAPNDFDLATDANPDEILNILNGKYRTDAHGKAFGVVVVYTKDEPSGMEIATFREDLSKGRRPEVKLGSTIETDVKRRDITYNSLFFDLDSKKIIDLVGGVDDLNRRITRMVGNPLDRFEEDPLRILRSFRFSARYEAKLSLETSEAILQRNSLYGVSPERTWEEMKKAWDQSKDYNYYLELITKHDMWGEIFPGIEINTELVDSDNFLTIITNLFKKVDVDSKDSQLKFHSVLVNEYKMESKFADRIIFLLNFSKNFNPIDVYNTYKLKIQLDINNLDIMDWIVSGKYKNTWLVKFTLYRPITSSKELMEKGFKGVDLGNEIRRLEYEYFKKGTK